MKKKSNYFCCNYEILLHSLGRGWWGAERTESGTDWEGNEEARVEVARGKRGSGNKKTGKASPGGIKIRIIFAALLTLSSGTWVRRESISDKTVQPKPEVPFQMRPH